MFFVNLCNILIRLVCDYMDFAMLIQCFSLVGIVGLRVIRLGNKFVSRIFTVIHIFSVLPRFVEPAGEKIMMESWVE